MVSNNSNFTFNIVIFDLGESRFFNNIALNGPPSKNKNIQDENIPLESQSKSTQNKNQSCVSDPNGRITFI